MQTSSTFLPSVGAETPWQSSRPPRLASTAIVPETFDCTIVGAGFTGVACARRLAALRPDWTIALVDAMRVGQGSSGRNSGFVMEVGHWHGGWTLETNEAVRELSEYGIGLLRSAVHAHSIECDWHEGDRYHVAVNRRGRRALREFVDGMRQMGCTLTEVDPEEFARRTGTHHYSHAFESGGGALVNPAQLIRGMAAALPDSVYLIEDEPVTEIKPGVRHALITERRHMQGERMALATNGFMGAFGVKRSRVLPFATFASVTEPLNAPPGSLEQWGLVPEERMGSTVRLTADRRILIRNGVALSRPPQVDPDDVRSAARGHRASLAKRFPELAELPFSHCWGGVLGVSNNGGTVFGSFGDRAWVAGVHNGVGMAQGAAMGDLLAFSIAGEGHPLLERIARLPEPSWVPPEPLLSIGVRAYTGLLSVLAGDEK